MVFEKPENAQEAISEVHGFELFGKPMRCAMARAKSDKTIEQTGSAEELDAHKRHRLAEKGKPLNSALSLTATDSDALQTNARRSKSKTSSSVALPQQPTAPHSL